ncbi:MAG TPA: sigma 54-interacting transcriptional regulator, partial [Polyangiaceae bacterium]|nr:sigma 54-interacting transcriptional regulator [Polyangiaceae bacterium]
MRDGTHTQAGGTAVAARPAYDGEVSTTLDCVSSRSGGELRLQLLALEATGLALFSLPTDGSVSIGRGEECEIRLGDALVSRRHALLHVRPLSIQDAGSANGTKLGAERLAPGAVASIEPGQAISVGQTLLIVRRAAAAVETLGEHAAKPDASESGIVVCDPVMKKIFCTIERLAQGQINVLIVGETGVGKEVAAEAIHRASPRRDSPMLRLNCASLSEALLESELFGHERGAFTGACSAKPGLIELADGGTVFLDEVGELAPALQAKLLRLIETRELMRVGGVRPRPIDVRFLFATNRDLQAEVQAGRFRADLFFRLSGAVVQIPPLRERRSEILTLAEACVARAAARLELSVTPRFSSDAEAQLLAHAWPGNVRELRNAIERAVLLSHSSTLRAEDLALDLGSVGQHTAGASLATVPPSTDASSERDRIARALVECGGNQSRAAAALGMPRRTFVRR